jgi:hypothetical protein
MSCNANDFPVVIGDAASRADDDFIKLVVQVWLAAWNFPVPGCVYLCTMAARTGEAIVDILQWKPCRVATELALEDKEALVLVAVAFAVRNWAIAVAGNNIGASTTRPGHKRAKTDPQKDATKRFATKLTVGRTFDDGRSEVARPRNELRKSRRSTETSS